MKGRELLILRHGKSSWDRAAATDLDRPLAGRGKRDAPRMAAWLEREGLVPDLIVSSPAKRARQTARRVAKTLGLARDGIVYDKRIYEEGMREVLDLLGGIDPAFRRVLLVGHNPTLEALVAFLGRSASGVREESKSFPTCALAWIRMPDSWAGLAVGSGDVIRVVLPRELPA